MSPKLVVLILILHSFGCYVYFSGYFSVTDLNLTVANMDDLPQNVASRRLNPTDIYNKTYSKVVLMVIDALRFDFIFGENSEDYMPFVSSLLNSANDSCSMKVRVDPPTVTLPRLKAILTGNVPNFFDVINNLGSHTLNEDNFVQQAHSLGYNITFYGDETWLNLLPNVFKRSEGTSSFFVNDYTEVDNNVTRNLKLELARNDWDVMILHYLGLDHIGHIEGPYSQLVKPKLREMDQIVESIYKYLTAQPKNQSGLFVICGDHGMKDSGGHGGSTYAESVVPVVMFNYRCDRDLRHEESRQIDLAPLMSVLMGLPIPAGSIGILTQKLLSGLNRKLAAYAIYYNTLRLYTSGAPWVNPKIERDLNNGIVWYDIWLLDTNNATPYHIATQSFFSVQNELSSKIRQSRVQFKLGDLYLGAAIIFRVLSLSLGNDFRSVMTKSKTLCCTLGFVFVSYAFLWCKEESSPTLWSLLKLIIFIGNLTSFVFFQSKYVEMQTKECYYLFVSIIVHALSLFSSSLVEEEHQFWYFNFTTFMFYYLVSQYEKAATPGLLLIFHRLFREFNRTGDKWAHLPDLSDWLQLPDNRTLLSISSLSALILVVYVEKTLILCTNSCAPVRRIQLSLSAALGTLVYLFNVTTGEFSLPGVDHLSSFSIARCFWICMFLKALICLYRDKTRGSFFSIWSEILSLLLFAVCFLVKPHNLPLVPSLVLFSTSISKLSKSDFELVVFHHWLGILFYFYMGGVNNLNLDISIAYKGLTEYNSIIVGIYLLLHTCAAPIISFLLLIRTMNEAGRSKDQGFNVYLTSLALHALPVFFFMIISFLMREHLFVWSVFSPKLLHLFVHSLVNVFLLSFTLIMSTTCRYLPYFSTNNGKN